MSMIDHAVQYDRGWKEAASRLKNGETAESIFNLFNTKESFDIGARDCVQQFKKSGESSMIKIASCVIVIDPKTGYVLGATRRGTTDDWGVIGGKTDGEAPMEAAHREFEEETGWRLISAPDYIGCFIDEEGWYIHVYIVLDSFEAEMICDTFREGHREVEPGILVGLIPYSELMVKTFAKFNIDLLTPLLKILL